MVTVTDRLQLKSAPAIGGALRSFPAVTITSGKFPDFRQARFQCGGANQTTYETTEGSAFVNNEGCVHSADAAEFTDTDDFPDSRFVGISAARKDGLEYLVVGFGLTGDYANNLGDGQVDACKVTVFNRNGTVQWSRNAPLSLSDGSELVPAYAGIGDYLGTGNDVVRLVYDNEATGKLRYQYFELDLGGSNPAPSRTVTVGP
jgi:hypothetical protein